MNIFAPHITDVYKTAHASQYAKNTEFVTSNFTPRDFGYAPVVPGTDAVHMVYAGLQYVVKEYLIKQWNETFFNKPKEEVLAKYARRLKNCLGSNQGMASQEMMGKLHDLGYLPIKIKSLPEGSRVNPNIPVFTITNTIAGFGALVNYLETVLSACVWPICNSASLSEQYYNLSKQYGKLTGASEDFWLPFANHNFAMRGHRGIEDAIISAFGHILFHKGTDTFGVIDFAEEYYNANSDTEMIGVSVNASEHATACQQIAIHNGDEKEALKYFLTQVYPTGVFSYVSDSKNYWSVIGSIAKDLKDIIVSRQPNEDGQPAVLTFRPDSGNPADIICGNAVIHNIPSGFDAEAWAKDILEEEVANETPHGEYGNSEPEGYFRFDGKIYKAVVEIEWNRHDKQYYYIDGSRLKSFEEIELTAEQKGTVETLWEIFGGELVIGDDGKQYKLLDSHVRVIFGEAISLATASNIYKGLTEKGFSVGNVLFGVGSYAFIGNSTRDSYGIACKATNSVVGGVEYPLQKEPKGTSTMKKSAKGRLRVEKEDGKFVLYQEQTPEQEGQGELKDFFIDGKIVNKQSLKEIRERLL